MTEPIERQLVALFSEDAEGSPTPDGLAAAVMTRHRQVRLRRASAAAAVTAVVVSAAALVGWNQVRSQPIGIAETRCVSGYSAKTVTGRSFAFAGTITRVTRNDDSDPARAATSSVTFTVDEWFHGGSGPAVTVDVPLSGDDGPVRDETVPRYEKGTRLLVSGDHRHGGTTMADAVAWGCGFTRPYQEATARQWRAAEATR